MVCSECGSDNTKVEMVNDKLKHRGAGFIRKLMRLCLVICTCGIWLLVPKGLGSSRIKQKKYIICNNCGHSEKIKVK